MVYKDPDYMKKYRQQNKEQLKKSWDIWYSKNKIPLKEKRKIYKSKVPDKVKKWKRDDYNRHKEKRKTAINKYYLKNKKRILLKRKEWFNNHQEQVKKLKKKGERKRRAVLNNVIELFTQEEWENKVNSVVKCPRCNIKKKMTLDHIYPLNKAYKKYVEALSVGNYTTFPTIYTIESIRPLCRECNSGRKKQEED